jgi:hypothetical protein
VPELVPASLEVPRVLKRTTVIPAMSGNRFAAFLKMCESIIPPPDGFGWSVKSIGDGAACIGAATSPTNLIPSAVVTVNAVRIAGKTVLGRIG